MLNRPAHKTLNQIHETIFFSFGYFTKHNDIQYQIDREQHQQQKTIFLIDLLASRF